LSSKEVSGHLTLAVFINKYSTNVHTV